MKKNAELTTQQLVILIILIASFVIILFLLFRLNIGKETNEELCRNSVVLSGKSVLPNQNSLTCYTTNKCLTEDGTCNDELLKPEIVKIKTQDDLYKELATQLTTCWWMYGEGKVNYVEKGFTKDNYCSICYQNFLDDSLKNIIKTNKLDKKDLYDYMARNKMPGREITYLQHLFGTTSQLKIDSRTNFGEISFGEKYVVIMGIKNEISQTGWILTTAAGAALVVGGTAAVVFGAPVTIPVLILTATGATGGAIAGSVVATTIQGDSGNEFLSPSIVKVTTEEYKSLKCDDIISLSK